MHCLNSLHSSTLLIVNVCACDIYDLYESIVHKKCRSRRASHAKIFQAFSLHFPTYAFNYRHVHLRTEEREGLVSRVWLL